MVLTAREEMEIIAFAFLVENMKRDVQDRITVLQEIRLYVNILRSVINKLKQDKMDPEIMQRVRTALAAMRRMVIMLYRVQDGLNNYQYFNLGAFNVARSELENAITALNSDDPEISDLFADGVATAETRIGNYLENAAKDAAKKKIVQVTTILFCVLEIAYRIPIPIARLNSAGMGLTLAIKNSTLPTLYHDDRTVPKPPDWDDLVGKHFIGGFNFDYQGLHILNNVVTVDKNLIVAFRRNWSGVKLLAKHNLTQVDWMIEIASQIRNSMEDNLQEAQENQPSILYPKVVEWNTELNALKYSGWFEILTEGTASQNLSTDIRTIEEIQDYLDRPEYEVDYSEGIINLFLGIVPSLSSILFSRSALTRTYNGLAELSLMINQSINQDQALLNKLSTLNINNNPLYQELFLLYSNFVNSFSGYGNFLANLGLVRPSDFNGILRGLNPTNVMNYANELYQGVVGGISLGVDVWNFSAQCLRNNPGEPEQAECSATALVSAGPPYPAEQEIVSSQTTLETQSYKLTNLMGIHNNVVEADNPFGPYTPPSWIE